MCYTKSRKPFELYKNENYRIRKLFKKLIICLRVGGGLGPTDTSTPQNVLWLNALLDSTEERVLGFEFAVTYPMGNPCRNSSPS